MSAVPPRRRPQVHALPRTLPRGWCPYDGCCRTADSARGRSASCAPVPRPWWCPRANKRSGCSGRASVRPPPSPGACRRAGRGGEQQPAVSSGSLASRCAPDRAGWWWRSTSLRNRAGQEGEYRGCAIPARGRWDAGLRCGDERRGGAGRRERAARGRRRPRGRPARPGRGGRTGTGSPSAPS